MAGDLVGTMLGHYRIVEKIGEGGMGVVFKAHDEKLQRAVAVKVLSEDFGSNEERRRRFLREARVAAGLNHPNIATVHDVGEAEGRIYIAMELLEGTTLRHRLQSGSVPVTTALSIAKKIAHALVRAHAKGIVHRDLKPENVMVTDDLEVKVLDFGVAKPLDQLETLSVAAFEVETEAQLTGDGRILGTPGYMSPEQSTGRAIDARTDLFALGVVLYEMVTGTRPFRGASAVAAIVATNRDEPVHPSKLQPMLSPEIERIILRCLEKTVEARYPTARALLSDLDALGELASETPGQGPNRRDAGAVLSQPSLARGDVHEGPKPMARREGSALIVDDDEALGRVLAALLEQDGLEARPVTSARKALAALEERPFDVVITDLRMPDMDGMALLRQLVAHWPDLPVIMLTAHGNVPLAVEAMKAGAADFVLKPFDREDLLFVIRKVFASSARRADATPEVADATRELLGDSPAMREVHTLVRRAALATSTVLVLGETGTGKELVAHAVHEASPRKAKPFVKLNCGAFPDTLLESELFGYEKGAFTGAVTRKPGRIELAHQGTLFLDEIGDVTAQLQVKLLRVLQEREVERLGGTATIKVDVRFIAATHRDLAAMIAQGQFREDFYYRLNVVPIHIPPLRARREDIRVLALRFAAVHSKANGKRVELGPTAIERIERENWPGNVRQLQNFIERLVVLSDGRILDVRDVERELGRSPIAMAPPASQCAEGGSTLNSARRDSEREAIRNALTRASGNRTVAARILGLSRRGLYYKLDEYGLT